MNLNAMKLLSVALLAVVVLLLISNANPSAVKEIWIFSYFRFATLAALAGVAVYLLASLRSAWLMTWNSAAFVVAVSAMLAAEAGLRLFPGAVSDEYLVLFPEPARKDIAAQRGMFTASTLNGNDMLYAYLPGWQNPRQPWLKIDADGYRNPQRPVGALDVVLLGDSVMIAQGAKKDLADQFRDAGLTAANYGFSGYGILQYRDVYRAMVLKRGIRHRWVVVMITADNDLANTRNYVRVKASGGNWRDYLDRPPSFGWPTWGDWQFTPWSVSAVLKLPFLLRQRQITARKNVPLVMPRGTVMTTEGMFWFPDVEPGKVEWRAAQEGLREMIDDAAGARARVVLALAPNSGLIYAPYVKGLERRIQIIEANRRRFVSFLRTRLGGEGVRVIDLTGALQKAVGVGEIAQREGDYHLNDRGVEIVFEQLRQAMTP
jgi:hypothetical protein